MQQDSWDGCAYRFSRPYVDGGEEGGDPFWDVWDENGNTKRVEGPRTFLHSIATLTNEPIARGFRLLRAWEHDHGDINAKPGSWDHFMAMMPPYLTFWWRYEPA